MTTTNDSSGGVVRVGIDENGLGPRLGPLIVTAVAARTSATADAATMRSPRGSLSTRIGDSKKLVSFGDSDLGEAWARVLTARGGLAPGTPDALILALSMDSREALERPCPSAHRDQCWGTEGEAFATDDELLATLTADTALLRQKRGIELLGVEVAIVCTERLNERAAAGVSRFVVDLHAMERLALRARDRYGPDLDVTCGKVGGYASYTRAFGPLSSYLTTTLEEGRARSAYRVANVGTIAFVRDADDSHLLVALASLVGKWVRDFLMRRVTRYHRAADAALPEVSGYHDPVTAGFVDASALMRRARGVPDACFERRSRS